MSTSEPDPPRLWRAAGFFVLAYVASFLVSIAIIGPPTVHEGRSTLVEHSWSEAELSRVLTGGYVLVLGYLCLIVAMTFLARALGRSSDGSRWASLTATGAAIVYVVTIVAGGFAPGAAALWGRENRSELTTLFTVNDIRNFAYFIALPVMGTYVLAVATAALHDRILIRWTGWCGVLVGIALLLAVPAASYGIQYGMPLWLLWWLGVGISLVRHRPRPPDRPAPRPNTSASGAAPLRGIPT